MGRAPALGSAKVDVRLAAARIKLRDPLIRLTLERFEIIGAQVAAGRDDPLLRDLPADFVEEAVLTWHLLTLDPKFRLELGKGRAAWLSCHAGGKASPDKAARRRLEKWESRVCRKYGLASIPSGVLTRDRPWEWTPSLLSLVSALQPPVLYAGMPDRDTVRLLLDLRYAKARILAAVEEWIDRLRPQKPRPSVFKGYLDCYRVMALQAHGLRAAEIARLLWPEQYEAAAQRYLQRNHLLQQVADRLKAGRTHLDHLAHRSSR